MQTVDIKISVDFRSDEPVNKSLVKNAICNLLLSVDREDLFRNRATYAGYEVHLIPGNKR